MPKTRLQIQNNIQDVLSDLSGVYFTPQFIQDSIQDAYDEMVLDSECIEAVTSINWQPNLIYYDLHDLITAPNFWKPVRIFNHDTNRWPSLVDVRFLDKFRWDWELSTGSSWFCYIVNWQYMAFFPHQVTTSSNFDVFYKGAPDKLISDNQPLQIPDPYTKAIESWVIADLLEGIQEFDKAKVYWTEATKSLKDLKDKVKSRMFPEFVPQLNDLQFPYPTLP